MFHTIHTQLARVIADERQAAPRRTVRYRQRDLVRASLIARGEHEDGRRAA